MAEAPAGEKLKVFISYSRRDGAEFADELVAGLDLAGFAPFLDRHDIAAGEDWEARLGGLIAQSDTVVFVITPEAIKSEQCAWEVDKTLEMSKRLLPVIYKPVPDTNIPEKLRRLQFVRFDIGRGFARPLSELAEALRQDVDWIREHTRFGELAARWQARSRPESLLLRGDELEAAKAWVSKRRSEAPQITDLQRTFLDASEAAESSRLAGERARLEEMRRALEATRKHQRQAAFLLSGVGILMATIIAVLVVWWKEQSIRDNLFWFTNVRGYVLTATRERALRPKDVFKECANCPDMVVIAAGEFVMGSPANEKSRVSTETPQHKVTIARPFAVAKFELTFDEWNVCSNHGDCPRDIGASNIGRGQQPVITVNWEDAQRYVRWLSRVTGKSYRLLSESEWEYAARAATLTRYSFGDDESLVGHYGWHTENSGHQAHPVGEKRPNEFGLYDMHGNVWEWVEDCWNSDFKGAPADGAAWLNGECSRRVIRGGSWNEDAGVLRSASRNRSTTGDRGNNLGLRVARTLAPGAGGSTALPTVP
jgi:formylglycine-generating enzyme required for sulfatase activity